MPTQKNFDQLLTFVNLYEHAKNQFIPSAHSSDTATFRAQRPDWPQSDHAQILTMPNIKIFDQLLIFVNLYQHAQN